MNEPKPGLSNLKIELSDDDAILLESLLRSPVMGSLKRLLEAYRSQIFGALTTATEIHRVHQLQGIIMGLATIENLPALVVSHREKKSQKQEQESKKSFPHAGRLSNGSKIPTQ